MRKYIILLLLCGFIGNAQYNLFARQNFAKVAASAYDVDAQAFITAAGLTDNTQKNAINQLVLDLKSNLLWDKMKAVYPLVGGTAFTHKWNLKDPRDLDAAFRLTYSGTLTHDSGGITGSSNGACLTQLFANTLTASSNHLSNYCSTDTNGFFVDIGGDNIGLYQRFSNTAYSDNPSSNRLSVANISSLGFYVSTRTSTASHKLYRNSDVLAASTTPTTTALLSSNIGLLFLTGSSAYYSNRRYGWFSIGDGLSDSDVLNLYTAVQAYQTTLGRQVP